MITEEEKAYIAGLIDVRLFFGYRSNGVKAGEPRKMICLQGTVKSDAIAQFLQERIGGKLIPQKRSGIRKPCSEHCPEAHVHYKVSNTRWSVMGSRAVIALWNVQGYMLTMDDRLRAYLAAEIENAEWKGKTVDDMASKGWAIPDRGMVQAS